MFFHLKIINAIWDKEVIHELIQSSQKVLLRSELLLISQIWKIKLK